jgi:hypothetical protein
VEIEGRALMDRSSYDDGQLPWLQAVEDEDEPRGLSARKMLAALMVVLLAGGLVAGTFFWLGRQDTDFAGAPELIRAEPGPYKVKPADPGGLDVAGESQTAFETSAGEDRDSQLDLSKLNEPPPVKPKAEAPPGPATPPAPPPEPKPAPAPSGAKGSVIQIGAFQNRAQAERAWTALAARFPEVSGLNRMLVPFAGGIRLRAGASSPDAARAACQALKAGGENCFVAQ